MNKKKIDSITEGLPGVVTLVIKNTKVCLRPHAEEYSLEELYDLASLVEKNLDLETTATIRCEYDQLCVSWKLNHE